MIKTREIPLTRGQTMPITITVKDGRGNRLDLTGAKAYMWITADIKVPALVKLASEVTADHRVAIVFLDQTGEHRGDMVVTMIPSDSSGFVALGNEDPYLFDVWIVTAAGERFPVLSLSRMPVFPQATTPP